MSIYCPSMVYAAPILLVVPVYDVSKPPARRVSMSLRTLANTWHSILLSVGERKRVALSAHFSGSMQQSTVLMRVSDREVFGFGPI
jgi:6-phosphogluconolactonase/glucosamine-6-phosphate isomerase/deaminase